MTWTFRLCWRCIGRPVRIYRNIFSLYKSPNLCMSLMIYFQTLSTVHMYVILTVQSRMTVYVGVQRLVDANTSKTSWLDAPRNLTKNCLSIVIMFGCPPPYWDPMDTRGHLHVRPPLCTLMAVYRLKASHQEQTIFMNLTTWNRIPTRSC